MRVLDLFSGVGMMAYGMQKAGHEIVAFCEIEEWPRRVLDKHWPDVPKYTDVRELNRERLETAGITRIDIITGGWPCQDLSVAGKRAGIYDGARSGLWSECARLISELRPKYAVFENVGALLSGGDLVDSSSGPVYRTWFARVLRDLAEIGYSCEWHCIPAGNPNGFSAGAPHRRERIWIVAYPDVKPVPGGGRGYSDKGDHKKARARANVPSDESVREGHDANTHDSRLEGRTIPVSHEKNGQAPGRGLQQDLANTEHTGQHGSEITGSPQKGSDGGTPGKESPLQPEGLRPAGEHGDVEEPSGPGLGDHSGALSDQERGRTGKGRKTIRQGDRTPRSVRVKPTGENMADPERIGQPRPRKPLNASDQAPDGKGETNQPLNERQPRVGTTEPGLGLLAHGIAARLAGSRWLPEPGIGRVATGVPDRVHKLKALGNGLVWQIPYAIGCTIGEKEK